MAFLEREMDRNINRIAYPTIFNLKKHTKDETYFCLIFSVFSIFKYLMITELPERESPRLQSWDESEVKPGVSFDTLMV